MSSFLDLCEKFFESRDFYEILKIDKNASEKEVKKAYHKLSLLVHPDRVEESNKAEATEKFKVLGRIHSVLGDKEKRKIYDESGQFDDDADETAMRDWTAYWRMLFKEITIEDINNYEKTYKGSEIELKDLKRAYVDSKGNMDYILETVPFTNCDDEPRLHELVRKMIDDGEVQEYKSFTQEPEAKKLKRRRKWEKEAEEARRIEEAAKLEKEDGFTGDDEKDLAIIIRQNQQQRAKKMHNFFDMLTEKYAKPKARKSTPLKNKRKRTASPTKDSKSPPPRRLRTRK
ncbi:dnaJ homolog subfamily C member 9 [Chrysoperla carnea]|uniref:dnaJ homolog subfamily C member 9 n=1 Tax=Chrysoperla carnea TaxID=189513 RepID=UPI001D092C3C|nr:dnaJ homolog subfamily C member 9 [Chrysoperla carnea]